MDYNVSPSSEYVNSSGSGHQSDILSSKAESPLRSGYSGIEEKSTPLHSFVEHVMTYSFPVLSAINFYLALRHLDLLGWVLAFVVAAPIAWVLGDLVSGLVHWFADTYGAEDTPVFGPWLIRPFRQHHAYPRDICTHGMVLALGNSCTVAMPFQVGLLYLMITAGEVSGTGAIMSLTLNLFTIAVVTTNVFHKWAHAEKPNRLISAIQRTRLVLTPGHHKLHHTLPFDSNYCITTGWLNPLLEKIRFFRFLESGLRLVGLKPEASYQPVPMPPQVVATDSDAGER